MYKLSELLFGVTKFYHFMQKIENLSIQARAGVGLSLAKIDHLAPAEDVLWPEQVHEI